MKFARSPLQAVLGIALLILLIPAACVVVDERMSRQLDDVDPTMEEMRYYQNDFAPGIADRRMP